MKHNLSAEGHLVALRPVEMTDAPFITELRTDPERAAFLHPISADVNAQQKWLETYFDRDGDYYFVVFDRRSGKPEGCIGIYNIDTSRKAGEWGRWILKPASQAALESAWLIYRIGFGTLGLEEVYCRTIVKNASVVSFHDSCGLTRSALLPDYFRLHDHTYDAVEHRLSRDQWPAVDDRLAKLILRLAEKAGMTMSQ